MKTIESIYRRENGIFLIELRLKDLNQFFNSFDPSPFHNKDIDDDAERYIVNSVRAFPLSTKLKLVFYLPSEQNNEASQVLIHAIDNFFDFKATMAYKDLRATLHEGRIALLFGLIFLIICSVTRTLLNGFSTQPLGAIFLEGLSIIGWVAMWRPIQIFLYDWWTVFRMKKVYERIRDMPIEVTLE
jgi:hypothetical protein